MPSEIDGEGNLRRKRGRPSKEELAMLAEMQGRAEPAPHSLGAAVVEKPRRPDTSAIQEVKRREQMLARGEFVVPRPANIDRAHLLAREDSDPPTALHRYSAELVEAQRWFSALANVATWREMRAAWMNWRPNSPLVREQLRNIFDAAELPCKRREMDLHQRAERERQPWRTYTAARQRLAETIRQADENRKQQEKLDAAVEASREVLRQMEEEFDLSHAPEAA